MIEVQIKCEAIQPSSNFTTEENCDHFIFYLINLLDHLIFSFWRIGNCSFSFNSLVKLKGRSRGLFNSFVYSIDLVQLRLHIAVSTCLT